MKYLELGFRDPSRYLQRDQLESLFLPQTEDLSTIIVKVVPLDYQAEILIVITCYLSVILN